MNRINTFLERLAREVESSNEQGSKLAQKERLKAILGIYTGDDEIIDSGTVLAHIRDSGVRPGHPTGILKLDALTGGFRPEQVITLSARPKSGKTSMALQLAANMADLNPVFLPLEQSVQELAETYYEQGRTLPMFYAPRTNKIATLEWVEHKIIESIVKFNSKIAFIDHLGYLHKRDLARDPVEQITMTMQKLKQIARQWLIPIVLIVHVRKGDPTEIPTTEDLLGSSGIHQESDFVIMMWKECYKEGKELNYTNNVMLSVQANRRTGKTGNVMLQYVDGTFIESDWIYAKPKSALDDF